MPNLPLNFGTDEQFARTKALFIQSRFTDEDLSTRLASDGDSLKPFPDNRVPADADSSIALEGLFLRQSRISQPHLESVIGAEGITLLASLGLIVSSGQDYLATVRIRPMYGVFVVSDLWGPEVGTPKDMPDDIVFPPDISNTLNYLRFVSAKPCENYLEACGGSGVAALLAASVFAKHAWSLDISDRSTQFARFSARLNGLANFTALTGDTYAPVEGMQFDRIAAHPPYVPVVKHTWIFHDGGDDGEFVTRKHIEALPKVLAPGGRFYCRCLSSDRSTGSIEHRIRSWLGPEQNQFDLALLEWREADPVRMALQSALRWQQSMDDLTTRLKRFDQLKVIAFQHVFMVIQRHDTPRAPFTVRRKKTRESGPEHFAWLVHWETLRASGCEELILDSVLHPAKVNLLTVHGIEEGQWSVASQRMEVADPYPLIWELDPLLAYALPRVNGKRTGRQLLHELVDEGAISGPVDDRRFAQVLGELASGGFLHVDQHGPPPPAPDFQLDETV